MSQAIILVHISGSGEGTVAVLPRFIEQIHGIHMRIGAIAAAFNILLTMNDYKPSMTWFAL